MLPVLMKKKHEMEEIVDFLKNPKNTVKSAQEFQKACFFFRTSWYR